MTTRAIQYLVYIYICRTEIMPLLLSSCCCCIQSPPDCIVVDQLILSIAPLTVNTALGSGLIWRCNPECLKQTCLSLPLGSGALRPWRGGARHGC